MSGPRKKQTPASKRSQTPQKRLVGQQQVTIQQEVHEGPLPHPVILQQYDAISPGAADRIISMAEAEAAHRRRMEEKGMLRMHRDSVLGQVFAFLVAVAGLGSSVLIAYSGNEWAAALIGGGTLVSLVYAFIKGRQHNK